MFILKNPTVLDVQEQHSPCFCLKIGQTDTAPERESIFEFKISRGNIPFLPVVKKSTSDLSSKMRDCEICTGYFLA